MPHVEPVDITPSKTALVVVDMQNDFVDPKGRIYTGKMVQKIIAPIKSLLEQAREASMTVMHTQSWYTKDDPRFSDHPKASKIHRGCLEGTWGAEIIDELKPAPGEPVIRKASYDCFFGTDFESVLSRTGFGNFKHGSVHRNRFANDCSVIVTGTVTNTCVDKAALGFYLRGYDVIVPHDCVAARDRFDQVFALHQFKHLYQARITRSGLVNMPAGKKGGEEKKRKEKEKEEEEERKRTSGRRRH